MSTPLVTAVCRFKFAEGTDSVAVESQMTLAIIVAEVMFGRARVRLGVSYYMPEGGRQAVVDTSDEVGQYVARLFTGLLIRRIGEESFVVERVAGKAGASG